MKKATLLLAFLLTSFIVVAQYKKDGTPDMRYKANRENSSSYENNTNSSVRYQNGYYRENTYVDGHYKTNNNNTNHDNFSTQGNTNPYTGQEGSRARDYSPEASNYGQGKTIHTGERGGQYYYNSHGNKTYVPKR